MTAPADPLHESALKIKWADKRIKKIDVLAHNYVQAGPFQIVIERERDAGEKRAKIRFVTDIPDDLLDETNAALGNLRSSLDSVAWAVANRLGDPRFPKNVSFPIGESQEAFESTGMQGKIKQVGADWAAFVNALKPYRGGNDVLYDLHTFNNADKHRTLTRIGQASAEGMAFTASFVSKMSFNAAMFGFALEDGDTLVTVSESDPDPDVKLPIAVAFCELGPDKVRGKPVVATLKNFSDTCKLIVAEARKVLF